MADPGPHVVTVLDRFFAVGVSRASFAAHLAAGRTAIAGEPVTDPATSAAKLTAVWIALDPA